MQETASKRTRLLLLDPPAPQAPRADGDTIAVHLSRERILEAARARRYRESMFGDIVTHFRTEGRKFDLIRKPYLTEKRHGWLSIE